MSGGARISDDGRYRYLLWRTWPETPTLFDRPAGQAGMVLWVMLNPSTADASNDDPTIRKCIGFSQRWGFAGLSVVNLFAYRATDPKKLFPLESEERIGPQNMLEIAAAAESHSLVVAAWGAEAERFDREHVRRVIGMLRGRAPGKVTCLKKTAAGHPWHPLYVPYEKALERLEE